MQGLIAGLELSWMGDWTGWGLVRQVGVAWNSECVGTKGLLNKWGDKLAEREKGRAWRARENVQVGRGYRGFVARRSCCS